MTRGRVAAWLLTIGILYVACARSKVGQPGTDGPSGRSGMAVSDTFAGGTPVFVGRDRESAARWKLTRQFYQKRGDAPAWIENRKPRRQMDELIAALQSSSREGLDPELYNVALLTERRREAGRGFLTTKGFDPEEAASLDVWLTHLYLSYASDLANGVSDLSHADPNWKIRGQKVDLLALLQRSIDENRVAESLAGLVPQHPQYVALRDALARYRDLAAHGGWQPLPARLTLKPGQRSPVVPALAARLAATGDYAGQATAQNTGYGPDLQEAVKRFQRRHGLEPDGAVGPAVVARMNVPVDARVRELTLNLERWRWLPRTLGDRFVLVNIPEYRLEVWDRGSVPLSMRVVVGKKDTPTPIFADDMTYVVFAPYWNVPPDIVKNETLPSVLRDPAFLERTNMEVLDQNGNPVDPKSIDLEDGGAYRFRQRPGASNSLGLVKFMFPNSYNVYLHDTPADSLFARATRSFSHGCVRVEQPEKLAEYVLRERPEWTPERIDEAMHGREEKIVKLASALPVYLGYWTARVSADGILQFRDDLYGVDNRQLTLLAGVIDRLKTRATEAATAFGTGARSSRADDRSRPASKSSRRR